MVFFGIVGAPREMIVVYVTAPHDAAARIARHLVEQRHAACVNILSEMRSIYTWEGITQDERECLLIAKTSRHAFEGLRDAVRRVHPYQMPEIIGVPVEFADPDYREWVLAQSRSEGGIAT